MKKLISISAFILVIAICIPGMIFSHSFLGNDGHDHGLIFHMPRATSDPLVYKPVSHPLLSLNPAYHYTGAYFNIQPVFRSSVISGDVLQFNVLLTLRRGNALFLVPKRFVLPLYPDLKQQGLINSPKN